MKVQAKMSEEKAKVDPMQQVGLLNLRINDMITQLNTVMKMMMDDNTALKKENSDLKAKQ